MAILHTVFPVKVNTIYVIESIYHVLSANFSHWGVTELGVWWWPFVIYVGRFSQVCCQSCINGIIIRVWVFSIEIGWLCQLQACIFKDEHSKQILQKALFDFFKWESVEIWPRVLEEQIRLCKSKAKIWKLIFNNCIDIPFYLIIFFTS